MHFLQFTRLLNASQRGHDRIEQVKQHQHAVLIVMQRAIVGLVALAAIVMQPLKQGSELVEVFESDNVFGLDLLAALGFAVLR